MTYDFKTLSHPDFEDLVRDLIGRRLAVTFEAFSAGPDQGIDGRHSKAGKTTILQAKHYAGSPFSTLKAAMKKERSSIDALHPDKYLLATSISLTPARKKALSTTIGPALRDERDIFGQSDLNGLLRAFPDVEKSHIKLWLSSSGVLDRVLHAAAHAFAAITRAEIEAKVKVYAQNPSFSQSATKLEEQHVLIISGPPGVGKTTLAEMLAYAYLAEGWDLIPIMNLTDGFAAINDTKKQVFIFDDFLGRIALDRQALSMKDSELARFLRRVKSSPNARFILTTRAYIFEEARRVSEHLADHRLDVTKYVLDVGIYTRRIRARILYNHLSVAGTDSSHIRALVETGTIEKIVDHKNYNPRIIEWMTDKLHSHGIDASEYPTEFLATLNNPSRLWDIAFRNHIDARSRHLLYTLFFCQEFGEDLAEVRVSFEALHAYLCQKYGQTRDPKDFEESVKILEGSFINIRGTKISYVNPSFRDYMAGYLQDGAMLRDFVAPAARFGWANAIWRFAARSRDPGTTDPELAKAFIPIVPILSGTSIEKDAWFGAVGSGSERLEFLLQLWTHSQSDVFAEAAFAIAENPTVSWKAWRDGTNLIELTANLRDGGYYDNFPNPERLARRLESRVAEMLRSGVDTDDLELMSDAVEEAKQLLSPELIHATQTAIETEIELAGQRAADTDSESTLEERISSLSKLAPRADIPSDRLDWSIAAITERIQAIREETEKEDGPDFTPPKPEVDVFDDAQLRDLFALLLTD
ncbi:ATP-binding protein [Rhizobium sp. NTR19]|uniref:ATP-binding protein n=1 Tax=Neorhizobium turbinariae TaxID=2937795 RepID=A0ABT0IXV1_9HYPH|nr:ATP-binding protein [Neorhizobium turbinariae]MCK8782680.1 ATP-binding protein [Neorhizobium turbinariae]